MDTETKFIQIVVNGQVRQIPDSRTLAEALAFLEIDPARVAVELNRAIVRRESWDRTRIEPGAALEVVQFVGGG
jgi:thiamine biosynthesis protein ThiS